MIARNNASILILTLLILSVITIFTQQLVRSVYIGSFFVHSVINTEKAKMLALGGVNIAMAQLFDDMQKESHSVSTSNKSSKFYRQEADKDLEKKRIQSLLTTILPHLNRWYEVELTEEIEGINGTIKICISCEHGKINLNEAFDFDKGEFDKTTAQIIKQIQIKDVVAPGVILKKMTEFFKNRKKKLDDISQLLTIKELASLNLFYKPARLAQKSKRNIPNTSFALYDLFTLETDGKLEPLMLSDSVCGLLSLRRPLAIDAKKNKKKFKYVIENVKKDRGDDWQKTWQQFIPLYDRQPVLFNQVKELFNQVFEPYIYSVLSCASVAGIEQSLLVIIQATSDSQKGKESKQEQKDINKKLNTPFVIRRIYWL